MAFARVGSIARGEIAGPDPGAAKLEQSGLTTLTMDVRLLETLSVGSVYFRGAGSSVSQITYLMEVSYDEGSTFVPATINKGQGTPPDMGFEDNVYMRKVSTSDEWSFGDILVASFPLVRFVVTVTGTPSATDTLNIQAYGENETGG